MELVQLRLVKQIIEAGSLSKAAMHLNRAPSVVSRQIAALERECGGRIFYRNGRGVLLTELGERLLPQIELILETSRTMIGFAAELKEDVSGKVRVGALPAVARSILVPLIEYLRTDYPEISLCMSEMTSGSLEAELTDGQHDIGVFLRAGTAVGREDHVIAEWETYLVGTPGPLFKEDTLPFKALAGVPLILASSLNFNRRLMDEEAAAIGMKLNMVTEVIGAGLYSPLLHAGYGHLLTTIGLGKMAFITPLGIELDEGRLQATRIIEPNFTRTLVVSTGSSPSGATQIVADFLARRLKEMSATPNRRHPKYTIILRDRKRAASGAR